MRRIGRFSTFYQDVKIWKSGLEAEFRVAGAVHAWYHQRKFLTGLAWDLIAAAPLLHRSGAPKSILMLGFAGGTSFRILRHLLPESRLVAVDIDRELVELAREYMDLASLRAEVVIGDAYEWLRSNREKFDVVIDDIYLAGVDDVYRPCQAARENLSLLQSASHPEGLLAVNLVTGAGHRNEQIRTRALLRDSHQSVRSLRTPGAMNEVLVAGRKMGAAAVLRSYLNAFSSKVDRDYWERISTRKLR